MSDVNSLRFIYEYRSGLHGRFKFWKVFILSSTPPRTIDGIFDPRDCAISKN